MRVRVGVGVRVRVRVRALLGEIDLELMHGAGVLELAHLALELLLHGEHLLDDGAALGLWLSYAKALTLTFVIRKGRMGEG